MGWSDHSDGDVTLTFLDFLVCKGKLKKISFKKGRGGHKYVLIINEPCSNLIKGKCSCDPNTYIKIDKGDEIKDGLP